MGIPMKQKLLVAALAALGLAAIPAMGAATVTAGTGLGAILTGNNTGATAFSVPAGATITVDFNYQTGDSGTNSNTDHNFAFYTVGTSTFLLAGANTTSNGALPAAQKASNLVGGLYQTSPTSATNLQTFTFTNSSGSAQTIGFGVAQVNGNTTAQNLLLDHIKVNNTLITIGNTATNGNDGSFEFPGNNPPGGGAGTLDLYPYSIAGGAVLAVYPGAPAADTYYADLTTLSGVGTTYPTQGPDTPANLSAATGANLTTLNSIALAQQTAPVTPVPLPAAAYVAPIGLIMAGVFAARQRRQMAS